MPENQVVKHSIFHWSVYTEIIIDAPKDRVWAVLTDFESMPAWSKSLQKIRGDLSSGSQTQVDYIFKGKLRVIPHHMVDFEAGTQFGWSDKLIPLAKDRHLYRVETLSDNKTKFIQKDEVKGPLAFLVSKMLMDIMISTYPEFNAALKRVVETS